MRLEPVVAAAKRAKMAALDTGVGEPASAQEVADRLRIKQEAIKRRKQGRKFAPIAALADADGVICHDPIRVTEIAMEYGVAQNRESNSDDEALKLWLKAFVPKGSPLTMPNGAKWRLRDVITPAVFRRETLKQKRDKANGLHPFLIDMIQMLPEDHTTIEIYYELMMRCMEDGVYPKHYLEIAAVLIPKKMDGILQMLTLRDIWLINHGAKMAERLILCSARCSDHALSAECPLGRAGHSLRPQRCHTPSGFYPPAIDTFPRQACGVL